MTTPQELRDPALARGLVARLAAEVAALGRPVTLMHVCGSHEQAIARFGLRAVFPPGLELVMGPGCPVCVTDAPEVDEAVALARAGVEVHTYGDMVRVPGSRASLADARRDGAEVEVVYSVTESIERARSSSKEIVFFATGFETTAVATAAAVLAGPPPSWSVLSAHKYIPPAMEVVAGLPKSRVEGFLAAGHAATITGFGVFEGFVRRHRRPVVVAGFEPLDVLAALVRLVEQVRAGRAEVDNAFPRAVRRDGNPVALEKLWTVFAPEAGRWRGVALVPDGNLRLRERFSALDARRRFSLPASEAEEPGDCICGDIMTGVAAPTGCARFGTSCTPEHPVGACMVSTEGACRIWHTYGGRPDLGGAP